jgi:SNF2 family DNA or RNA helicase
VVPREFVPHDYQQQALEWLYAKRRNALWMPMGGGKTVTTLTALEHLSLVEAVYPALVIAPRRVANSTWPDEVEKWSHLQHLRVSRVLGTPQQRLRALAAEAEIYTINYDNLSWLCETLGDKWPFKTIIADELTRLKSFRLRQGGSRARALGKYAHETPRFIGLTGTPAANGIKDLWGQIWFIDKGERLGRTHASFTTRWFKKGYDGYSLVPYDHSQEEIQEKLQDVCLTVTGLPVDEPIVTPVYIELTPSVRKVYNEMERELYTLIGDVGVEAANPAVRTQKLLQLSNGAVYTDDEGNWDEVHRLKVDALESVVAEANGAPVLVAYNFKHDLARLCAYFPKARVLDNDPQTIKDWNAGKIQMLLAHPASAGHGLNLADGGNILAFFGVNWNLEEHAQIIERIGPMRQKQAGYDRPMFIYPILASGTVDEVVMERLSSKRSVQEVLIDAMKSRAGK